MMIAVRLYPIIFLALAAPPLEFPDPVDKNCVRKYCNDSFTRCMDDRICVDNVQCVGNCWAEWDRDKTPQKYHVQNCTSMCTTSFDDDIYESAIQCLSSNGCIRFPPIANICRGPENIKMNKNISLTEMEGEWWNLRGYHPVYDCFPCQMNYIHYGTPSWKYKSSYQAYYTDGTLKFVTQSGSIVTNFPQTGFNVSLVNAGLEYDNIWWVFDRIDDVFSGSRYYLVYYCGNALEWNFEGALVLSVTPKLANSAISLIANSFQENVRLDFASFCSPSLTDCPEHL